MLGTSRGTRGCNFETTALSATDFSITSSSRKRTSCGVVERNTMYNVNPETGIRYGVIAANSLDPDLVEELFHGSEADNLSYDEAYDEAKAEAEFEYDNHVEEAKIAAAEVGADRELGFDIEVFTESYFEQRGLDSDREQFVDDKLEQFSDTCLIDEPVIEGMCEGVQYRISWLGGAPLVWALSGLEGGANKLCSPCVPNAADLDSGFYVDGEEFKTHGGWFTCYVIPRDWLYKKNT